MSVLINLLPDTRQQKLAARRRRQLLFGISVVIWSVCGGIVILLTLFSASQRLIITNDSNQINLKTEKLQATPSILEALTAQEHLDSLLGLYSQRTYMSHVFRAAGEFSPTDVQLQSINIDASNKVILSGLSKSYASVAKLARALEAQNITIGTGAKPENSPYFLNVNIQSASLGSDRVTFSISADMQPGATNGN